MTSAPPPAARRPPQGYPSDLDYTAGFYPETAPARLAFAAAVGGGDPGPAARPNKVLELGFGQGFGLALLAAANPDVRFEGCDFNPAHVAHARTLAQASGLANLEVSAASFEDLAADAGAEADCDVILAHGIMSWVSAETAAAVVEIVRRRLRPGGLFHVSYNCSPGRAPDKPLRDLVVATAARTLGTPLEKVAAAQDLLRTLRDGGASYIAHSPVAAQQVNAILGGDPQYLAHEYLGDHWRIFTIAEMAELLRPAGVDWLCSAAPTDNLPNLRAPAGLLPLITAAEGDAIWRETLKDFACNRAFRRDVFARGGGPSPGLEGWRFVLGVPREELKLAFVSPCGFALDGGPAFYLPVADLLTERPCSLGELRALPAFAGRPELLIECLCLLVQSGQVEPLPPGAPPDPASAQRFNAEVIRRAREGRFYGALASPLTRSGVPVRQLDLAVLVAWTEDGSREAEMIARRVGELLHPAGSEALDGAHSTAGEAEIPQLGQAVAQALDQRLPSWSRLGVLPAE